jgi:2-keto-4-pentenoate hydratase/2-oxohepta-3-ene-1,7-dioic acid hydratase in catechol pathway
MTGTPAGVIMGMKDPKYLESGDLVEVEIKGIGKIANHMVFEN